MTYAWVREERPRWDEDKARIVGGAPAGCFDPALTSSPPGASLPGMWWRCEDERGTVLGYGWLDVVWGDAEILLATDPQHQGKGAGTFILERLEDEARARGLNYLYNVVRPEHPQREQVSAWLAARGFQASDEGRLFRAVLRSSPINAKGGAG